jgi:hypothetical protein
MEQKLYYKMSDRELEAKLFGHYPTPTAKGYSVVAEEEGSNGSIYDVDATEKDVVASKEHLLLFEKWIKGEKPGGWYPTGVQAAVRLLVAEGVLPFGNYLIECYW